MILYKLVSTAACNPSGCAACRPLSISDPALYQLCLAAPGLCSGRDNQSYLFSPGHLGSCRCCALLCHTLVQCVVPHIVWTCGIIWALKISCYVPILLCKLKDSCYQSVPLWKAVSHIAGVFLHYSNFPSIPSPFWIQEAGLCMQRCFAVAISFPICFQTVYNAHFAARAQTGNIPPDWH